MAEFRLPRFAPALVALGLAAAFAPAAADPLALTDSERQWLGEHPVIRYTANLTAPPYSALVGGRHVGIDADLLEVLGRMLGVRFELLPSVRWEDAERALPRGEVDMATSFAPTPEREKIAYLTRPYLTLQFGAFTRLEAPYAGSLADLRGKRVAVNRSTLLARRLRRDFPEIRLVPVAGGFEGALAVSAGKADALIAGIGPINYAIRKNGISNLHMQFFVPYPAPLSYGVRRDWPELAAILDKALGALGQAEIDRIAGRRFNVPGPEYSRAQLLQALAGMAFAMALVIAAILFVKNRRIAAALGRTRQLEQELRLLSFTDPLTGLGNRRALDEMLAAEIRRVNRYAEELSLLECDLDRFKEINDTRGHTVGDKIMIGFAFAVRSMLRGADAAYRYGGEEFVVVLPKTGLKGACDLAERIRREIAERPIEGVRVTVSVGVASMSQLQQRTAEALFSAADKMLYEAKASGRNCVKAYGGSPGA